MSPTESLARHLCTRAGEDPDSTYRFETYAGRWGIAGMRGSRREDRPRWRHYEDFASKWLAAEEWRAGQ